MTKPDTPAFPFKIDNRHAITATQGAEGETIPVGSVVTYTGLTKREYAAIHLSVPDSGTDWLDEMIRKANSQKHAAAALQGILASTERGVPYDAALAAGYAVSHADALIAALAEGEKG